MKIERKLTADDERRLMEDNEGFFKEESDRLEKFLLKNHYFENKAVPIGDIKVALLDGDLIIDPFKRKISLDLNDVTEEFVEYLKSEGYYNEAKDGGRDALMETLYDPKTDQHTLYALMPGADERDIRVAKHDRVLTVTAGDRYSGRAIVPESVREISKSYKDGVLTIKLR